MNPEIFILPDEIAELVNTLAQFVEDHSPSALKHALRLNGMDVKELTFPPSPPDCAAEVVLAWNGAGVSDEHPGYHPLVRSVEYLLQVYQWKNQQEQLLDKLLKRGRDNLKALEICKAVGCIEYPLEKGVGTAILIGSKLIMTCAHVIAGLPEASVRFGYKYSGDRKSNKEILSLDLSSVTFGPEELDFAIVAIDGLINYEFAGFNPRKPSVGQNIRMIHHSQGKPLAISDVGAITSVVNGLLSHDITDVQSGSSGAPIFNEDWEMIALHRGPSSGITLNAIQQEIVKFFSSSEKIQRSDHLHVNVAVTLEQQPFIKQVYLSRERKVLRISDRDEQAPVKIALDFRGYGLDTEIANFQKALNQARGALAVEISGDSKLLESLVVEKILREFQKKIGSRTYTKREIDLYAEDVESIGKVDTPSGLEVIGHRIKVEKLANGIFEFLADIPKSQDIVFIIWCRSSLSQMMKLVAKSFWSAATADVWPKLIDRGRRIVVIWANTASGRRENIGKPFTAIPLPEKLDVEDLSSWFWSQLQKYIENGEIKESTVQAYVNSLKAHYGHLGRTYARLEEIAQELANVGFGKG